MNNLPQKRFTASGAFALSTSACCASAKVKPANNLENDVNSIDKDLTRPNWNSDVSLEARSKINTVWLSIFGFTPTY